MRTALAKYENQLVLIRGRKTEAHRQPDETFHVCLAPVHIQRFYNDRPMSEEPEEKISHLWLNSVPKEHINSVEMLSPFIALAEVYYYTRSNGSVDLSVRTLPSFSLDNGLAEVHKLLNSNKEEKAKAFTASLVHHCELNRDMVWSWSFKAHEILASLKTLITRWDQEACLTLSTLSTATANGPCSKPQELVNFNTKASTKTKTSLGFA